MRRGDLVVHYRKPRVVAFSRAREDGTRYDQLPILGDEDYGAGWRFRTEYFDLARPVSRGRFGQKLIPLRNFHYPINTRGHVRQGYLFPFDLRGLEVILSFVDEKLPAWLENHRPNRTMLPEEAEARSVLTEGTVTTITVNAYERNREARWDCITRQGAKCVVCTLEFGKEYGTVAEGLIHVHHLKPLSEVGERYVVDPDKDLCPVCPNCHAVIHLRSDPPYTIEEVRAFRAQAGRSCSS